MVRPSARRAAMLLEVLVSIGLMVFGLAVVGLRITTSLDTARRTQHWTTAMLLAETKLAEMQAGAVPFTANDDQIAGYFGIRYPGYSWRIQIEPCEIDNLYLMSLDIGFNPDVVQAQIDNPELEIDFDDQRTQILRTVHRLVPTPADLDLNRDFGIDLEALQEQMAGGGGGPGGEGGGGGAGDGGGAGGANDLWALINEFLTQHPEILNDKGGIDLEAIKNLPAEDFKMAMQILQQFVGRGAQLNQLQDQLSENLGEGAAGGGQGGAGGGRGGAGRGGQGGQGAGGRGGRGGQGQDGAGPGPDGSGGGGFDAGGPPDGGRGRGRGRDGGEGQGPGGGRGPGNADNENPDRGGGRNFGPDRGGPAGPEGRDRNDGRGGQAGPNRNDGRGGQAGPNRNDGRGGQAGPNRNDGRGGQAGQNRGGNNNPGDNRGQPDQGQQNRRGARR